MNLLMVCLHPCYLCLSWPITWWKQSFALHFSWWWHYMLEIWMYVVYMLNWPILIAFNLLCTWTFLWLIVQDVWYALLLCWICFCTGAVYWWCIVCDECRSGNMMMMDCILAISFWWVLNGTWFIECECVCCMYTSSVWMVHSWINALLLHTENTYVQCMYFCSIHVYGDCIRLMCLLFIQVTQKCMAM